MAARAPEQPGSIEPIATLPVFLKLAGRRALVAGGTPPATWKAELLAAAGAEVLVAAAEPCDEMVALAAALPDRLRLLRRVWAPADLDKAAVAVGAFEGDDGLPFRDCARAAGVPVNIIDVPSLCDFQFGTIVARSPLVIGISTDGAAPVLGQALRTRIEALLPHGIGAWVSAAMDWRASLQDLRLGFAARRRFWERFAEMALKSGEPAPTEADRQTCLEAALATQSLPAGRVILIGAGPGSPDLVTLQAVRALQSADTVLYEAGVLPAMLGLGRREARKTRAGFDAHRRALHLAREGQTVAWIGLGDAPFREASGEPVDVLIASGVEVDIVRGLDYESSPRVQADS